MKYRDLICVVVSMVAATCAFASVSNRNPYCVIATVGADSAYFSSPAEIFTDGCVVRLPNPQGKPLQGLKVEFFVNHPIGFPEPPPGSPPLPPLETYGHFEANYIVATTDAQGIARSGPFTAGSLNGSYEVAAFVWISFYPENFALCKTVPGPGAFFQITQVFGAASIPSSSLGSLFALALLITLMASAPMRRFLRQRR
jgi:hypothetical protein